MIGNLINKNGGQSIIVNGIEDHVHCLAQLKPTITISELMKNVKARSSKYINDRQLTPVRFEWQEEYGAFACSRSRIGNIYRYIQNQEEHHKKQTFVREYIGILEELGIEFDPRFVFQELA